MPFLNSPESDIYYERTGEGPILTLCLGLGDSFRNWEGLVQKLSLDFEVLFVQNRGAGKSFRPKTPFSIQDMALDVKRVWTKENITKSHVLGFSMGGRIALELALRSPKHIDKLILLSTSSGFLNPYPPTETVQNHMLQFDGSDDHFAKTFEYLYSPTYRTHIQARSFTKFRKSDPDPQNILDYKLQLKALLHYDVTDEIQNIEHSTFILAGDQDELTPYQNALAMHQKIKNSHIKIFEGTGHLLQLEKQKDFLEELKKFIKETPYV